MRLRKQRVNSLGTGLAWLIELILRIRDLRNAGANTALWQHSQVVRLNYPQALNLQSWPSELKRCEVNYTSIISEADCGAAQPETGFPESSFEFPRGHRCTDPGGNNRA